MPWNISMLLALVGDFCRTLWVRNTRPWRADGGAEVILRPWEAPGVELLGELLWGLPWGPHPGGFRVTASSGWPFGECSQTLWRHGRHVATVHSMWTVAGDYLTILSPDKAEELYQEVRRGRRAAARQYESDLQEVRDLLQRKLGGITPSSMKELEALTGLKWRGGQKGGSFVVHEGEGSYEDPVRAVSARGALRPLGLEGLLLQEQREEPEWTPPVVRRGRRVSARELAEY